MGGQFFPKASALTTPPPLPRGWFADVAEYLIDCPDCQFSQPVGTAQAGGEIACQSCGQPISVPRLGDLRQRPPAETTAPATKPTRSGGGLFLTFATLAALTILAASFCAVRWATIEVPATTDSHIAEVREAYPRASPAQLVREYEQINQYGIELPRPYGYHDAEVRSSRWRMGAIILGGVGLTSLAAAVVAGRR